MIPSVHATYSTVICYWYIRSLKLVGVNKYFGPYVVMIGKIGLRERSLSFRITQPYAFHLLLSLHIVQAR